MINNNGVQDFYKIAYVVPAAKKQLEDLLRDLSINMHIHEFLNECWSKAERVEDDTSLRFELIKDGDKTYFAFCKKNDNPEEKRESSLKWILTKIISDADDFISLKTYAWLRDESKFLDDIANLALPEQWTDNGLPGAVEKNNVLKKHLEVTFSFLAEQENGITESSDGRYSAFNTGLVDKTYDDIYVVFEKTKEPSQINLMV